MASSIVPALMARNLESTALSDAASDIGALQENSTLYLIEDLIFQESKSVRTSTVILAAFNILAAFTTAASILYDCYWASKRCNPKFKSTKFCVRNIHPAETFPLVLSIGIMIQGVVFAGVQSVGLGSLFVHDCGTVAQFMWPGLFIVPYLQLVFGLECAFRSLRKLPFQARGRYDVVICVGVVVLMLIGTWVPSHIDPEEDYCFASLVWFITKFGFPGFILLTTIMGLLISSGIIIYVRLSTVSTIDQHQRIAASRMVYYMVLAVVTLSFVLPWFISLTMNKPSLRDAMMATVVLNLSGLMTGLAHLFLRSNTGSTSFAPRGQEPWIRNKHGIRIWGPYELGADPVNSPYEFGSESRLASGSSLIGQEKARAYKMDSLASPVSVRYNPLQSNAINTEKTMPTLPQPVESSKSPTRSHGRNQSYTLFSEESRASKLQDRESNLRSQADSIYDITDLEPPPRLHFLGDGTRHRRDSSMNTIASSATVQIGLRLSHAPFLSDSQEDVEVPPLPSTMYTAPSTQRAASPVPQIQTQNLSSKPPARSPLRPTLSPLTTNVSQSPTLTDAELRNKTLPPTPRATAPAIERISTASKTQVLSPTVYSPESSRKPSPLLKDSSSSSRSSTRTSQSQSLRSPPPTSSSSRTTTGRQQKEWI